MTGVRLLIFSLVLAGCNPGPDATKTLTLATTTSTRDSGLLDVLLPKFEAETGINVKVVAVGSGQALELGRRGDADVLLTHASDAEEQFMADGHGELRRPVMFNDFVLVGPCADSTLIIGETSILEAFRLIAESEAPFVSRGDDSGTHMKERAIWEQARIPPQGNWYIEAGAGMAEILRIANERAACTLTDRATFLAQREQLDLVILLEGDALLQNQYSVIVVDSQKHPHIQLESARRFAAFLVAPTTQTVIGEFGVQKFGQPLFFVTMPETSSAG